MTDSVGSDERIIAPSDGSRRFTSIARICRVSRARAELGTSGAGLPSAKPLTCLVDVRRAGHGVSALVFHTEPLLGSQRRENLIRTVGVVRPDDRSVLAHEFSDEHVSFMPQADYQRMEPLRDLIQQRG